MKLVRLLLLSLFLSEDTLIQFLFLAPGISPMSHSWKETEAKYRERALDRELKTLDFSSSAPAVSLVTLDNIFRSQFIIPPPINVEKKRHLFSLQISVVLGYIIPTGILVKEESFFSPLRFNRKI